MDVRVARRKYGQETVYSRRRQGRQRGVTTVECQWDTYRNTVSTGRVPVCSKLMDRALVRKYVYGGPADDAIAPFPRLRN